jgi:divalent metal cation (Fe/Co/Zn/Cd) transporter
MMLCWIWLVPASKHGGANIPSAGVSAGTLAGSIALLAFGIDSLVETASGVILGWRLLDEIRTRSIRSEDRVERVEKITSRIAGLLLLALDCFAFALTGFSPM